MATIQIVEIIKPKFYINYIYEWKRFLNKQIYIYMQTCNRLKILIEWNSKRFKHHMDSLRIGLYHLN